MTSDILGKFEYLPKKIKYNPNAPPTPEFGRYGGSAAHAKIGCVGCDAVLGVPHDFVAPPPKGESRQAPMFICQVCGLCQSWCWSALRTSAYELTVPKSAALKAIDDAALELFGIWKDGLDASDTVREAGGKKRKQIEFTHQFWRVRAAIMAADAGGKPG